MGKNYGKDRRIDVVTVVISEVENILDRHLIKGVFESLYAAMENGSEILSSNQSAQRINIVGKGDRLI
jgi:hypothetical protein